MKVARSSMPQEQFYPALRRLLLDGDYHFSLAIQEEELKKPLSEIKREHPVWREHATGIASKRLEEMVPEALEKVDGYTIALIGMLADRPAIPVMLSYWASKHIENPFGSIAQLVKDHKTYTDFLDWCKGYWDGQKVLTSSERETHNTDNYMDIKSYWQIENREIKRGI